MGRQALKLARAMHPHLNFAQLESAVQTGECNGTWPLVYSYWTRELGIELDSAAVGYLYSSCAATLNNAVRLSVVGQTGAQTMLSRLLPEIENVWANVSQRDPFDFCASLTSRSALILRTLRSIKSIVSSPASCCGPCLGSPGAKSPSAIVSGEESYHGNPWPRREGSLCKP